MNNGCGVSLDIEEPVIEYDHDIEEIPQIEFEFTYCVSYRDPLLNEWILARGVWNDKGVWTPDGIFPE